MKHLIILKSMATIQHLFLNSLKIQTKKKHVNLRGGAAPVEAIGNDGG